MELNSAQRTFEMTIFINIRPVPLHGQVRTFLPCNAGDGAGHRGGVWSEDDFIAHLLVQRFLCEDKKKLMCLFHIFEVHFL